MEPDDWDWNFELTEDPEWGSVLKEAMFGKVSERATPEDCSVSMGPYTHTFTPDLSGPGPRWRRMVFRLRRYLRC